MAEGVEEAESNSGGGDAASAMLGAAMPCETSISSPTAIGGLKREFDAYQHTHHHLQASHLNRAGSMTPSAGSVSPIQAAQHLMHHTTTTGGQFHMQSSSPNAMQQQQHLTDINQQHLQFQQQQHELQIQQQRHQSHALHHSHPMNLKSEDFDKTECDAGGSPLALECHNSNPSPPPMSQHSSGGGGGGGGSVHRHHQQQPQRPSSAQSQASTISNNNNISGTNKNHLGSLVAEQHASMCGISRTSPITSDHHHSQQVAAAAAAHAHLNGTMQGMLNLQKLQSLSASIQQHSAGMPSLASLQGLAGLSAAAAAAGGLNSPLNLSVGSASTLQAALSGVGCQPTVGGGGGVGAPAGVIGGVQMPQLILASGQLIQGVQGAQLLIPTSQGITTQTILTIPVSQQINSNETLVQTLAALNSGAASLSNLQHLQSHQQQHHHLHHQQQQQQQHSPVGLGSNIISPNFASNSIQQLLAAIQSPQMHHQPLQSYQQQQQTDHQQQQQQASQHRRTPQHHLHHHHHLSHHMHLRHNSISPQPPPSTKDSCTSISHRRSISPSATSRSSRTHTPKASPPPSVTPNPSSSSAAGAAARSLTISAHLANQYHDKQATATAVTSTSSASCSSPRPVPSTSHQQPSTSSCGGVGGATATGSGDSKPFSNNGHTYGAQHLGGGRMHSPTASSSSANNAINTINRLTNGELTITKSTGPSPLSHHSSSSTSSSQPPSSTAVAAAASLHGSSSMKLSPSSMHMSPTGTDNSNADLLSDSPDEPTINQLHQTNVVDGIDLDEIKEFAKAFKLRRLSLGLTQTQVGQALSVTEGPAYSQSAICSALAAQMYAAQLSSQQQQNMFEKLDITPKSAQKIKPVLERWMKEAEESHWNRYKTGQNHLTDFIGVEPSKKRKRRTSFTPQALELLNAHFERNTHPSGTEITGLAHQLGYEREVIRIWFCNKRQALKNTVRMMSKSIV